MKIYIAYQEGDVVLNLDPFAEDAVAAAERAGIFLLEWDTDAHCQAMIEESENGIAVTFAKEHYSNDPAA